MFIRYEDFEMLRKNEWLWKYLNDRCKKASEYQATNGLFVKLYLKNNDDRYYFHSTLLKNGIKTFEGDINAWKRWILNEGPKYDFSQFQVLYLDIETDDRGSFDKDEMGTVIAGKKQILSVALEDQSGKQYYIRNENCDNENADEEYNLIIQMLEVISKYDVISAWNGNRFDFPFIKQRIDFHISKGRAIPFDLKLINKIDEMEKYKKYSWTKHERFALERVATDTVGEGKVNYSDEVGSGRGKFYELWKNHADKLKEYNLKDVTLMRLIDEKFKMYQTHFAVTEATKSTPEDAMYTSHVADNGLIRLNHGDFFICDSKPDKNEMEQREKIQIGGGFTFCYKPGFHKNIEVFDFKSHYPLVSMTFNISKETWVKNMFVDWEEVEQKLGHAKMILLQAMHEHRVENKIKKYLKENHSMDVTEQDMIDVMFEFTDKYDGIKAREIAIAENLVYTPCDINRDTIGWVMHPHRFYIHKKGSLPKYVENAVVTRDKSKYIFAQKNEDPKFYKSEEYFSMLYRDVALKIVANGAYGFTGLKSARFFDYNVADAITTVARWITKKSIIFARKQGYGTIQGDTDSVFLENISFTGTVHDINILFYKYYDEMFAGFNIPGEYQIKNVEKWSNKTMGKPYEHLPDFCTKKYYCLFEHEKTFTAFISVAKKRYYLLQQGHVKSVGGAFIKNDTNPLAKKLQKELCADILMEKFDSNAWYDKVASYKKQCFDNELDTEYLVFSKVYAKPMSDYGGPMVDENGQQRLTKDGEPRYKSVPCQIEMIKRLDAEGKWDGEVGDLIKFIIGKPLLINMSILREKSLRKKHGDAKIDALLQSIKNSKSSKAKLTETDFNDAVAIATSLGAQFRFDYESKQRGITIDEYKAGEHYDQATYWGRICTPLIEILNAVDKKVCYEEFGDLWGLSEKQIQKIIESFEEDNDEDDE
jgi:DNA polymerase elongation subunit (family B)